MSTLREKLGMSQGSSDLSYFSVDRFACLGRAIASGSVYYFTSQALRFGDHGRRMQQAGELLHRHRRLVDPVRRVVSQIRRRRIRRPENSMGHVTLAEANRLS